jgi:hypothetical protein
MAGKTIGNPRRKERTPDPSDPRIVQLKENAVNQYLEGFILTISSFFGKGNFSEIVGFGSPSGL